MNRANLIHDFYFGADRIRQFARFMAGIENSAEYAPVQMLGGNLVLKTADKRAAASAS